MVEGILSATGIVNLQGGVLGGDGTVAADVINVGGTVSPGSSAGDLQIDGDYTQSDTGTLRIELGGAESGEHDVLSVLGVANLDGELHIAIVDGFLVQFGQQFVILTADTVSGTFNAINCPGHYTVAYNEDNVTVTSVAFMGDSDADADIDLVDNADLYDCLAGPDTTPNATPSLTQQGCLCTFDFDGDDDVDLIDFATFQRVFSGDPL